jgi:predicted aldo/keto reductase-like oxidoreductase
MSDNKQVPSARPLARRRYGETDVELSIIGFGGIILRGADQKHADQLVAHAVQRGVNYFDVAPTYGDAELKLGPALEPYRDNVFLACKTLSRDQKGAARELNRSLKHLRTDHLDLYQLHSITNVAEDVDAVFAKGGAMETFIEAKESGKTRFVGFSAHSVEGALAAMDRYDFDSVLFPINFACFYKNNFGPQVIEKALSKGMAVLAIKALARQRWPADDPGRKDYPKCWYQPLTDPEEARLALRFALSQPITAAVSSAEESLFHAALAIATDLRPLSPEEEERLKELTVGLSPIFPKV